MDVSVYIDKIIPIITNIRHISSSFSGKIYKKSANSTLILESFKCFYSKTTVTTSPSLIA